MTPTPQPPPSRIVFDVPRSRKASWIRAAQPRKLVDWIIEHLDRAAKQKGKP